MDPKPGGPKPGFEPVLEPAEAKPGQVAGVVTVDDKTLVEATRRAAFATCFGEARFNAKRGCVWVQGKAEMGVRPGLTEVAKSKGQLEVTVHLFSDQTDEFAVTVVFAVGSKEAPLGLLAATESLPVGLTRNLAHWSDAVIAFAWNALHDGFIRLATKGAPPVGKQGLVPITLEVDELTALRVGLQVPFRTEVSR